MRLALAIPFLALAACTPPAATEPGFKLLDKDAYSSFVANWEPEDAPLCAAFGSKADWDKVMHPAPTMGGNQVFAPADTTWEKHAVLVLSRIVGDLDAKTFVVSDVKRSGDAIDVTYAFTPPAEGSAQFKDFFLLEVPGPLPSNINFTENGKLVCTTAPGASTPALPPPS